ncbi:hypothetical protein EJ04DRAFT_605595 [Polyplosphaeria fusca]|uniref:Peptidase S8/S53 domain-containing protein n=1 Tax=Polyplosphaeria fusca TaxID=682080 RepID=A0A9P4QT81_9PLEO|nr:hypothetical protein EJ04DRAFT_605595 [Polyplosphaeria fusca]
MLLLLPLLLIALAGLGLPAPTANFTVQAAAKRYTIFNSDPSKKDETTRTRDWLEYQKTDQSVAIANIIDSNGNVETLTSTVDEASGWVVETSAGEGVTIYVVEPGVEVHVKDDRGVEVFKNSFNTKILQIKTSEAAEDHEVNRDSTEDGHGTCIATKVLGQRCSVAKNATLVAVKTTNDQDGLMQAWDAVMKEVTRDPAKAKILWIATIWRGGTSRRSARFTTLVSPSCLRLAYFSQKGPQVTICAPGVDVYTHNNKDGAAVRVDGTSISAAIVARTIATYMNHNEYPWSSSTMDTNRVQAIGDYIRSSKSSWRRNTWLNIIWNGAGSYVWDHAEQAPPDNLPPPSSPQPPSNPKTCNGINNKHYVTRDTMIQEASFELISETQWRRWKSRWTGLPALTSNQTSMIVPNTCTSCWMTAIRKTTQWTGKLGAIFTLSKSCIAGTRRTYLRQAPMPQPWGVCERHYNVFSESYVVAGAGWLNSGFGYELYGKMKAKSISPSHWKFFYSLGDDGREWTAQFNTVVSAEDGLEDVLKELVNWPGLGIDCKSPP